MEDPFGHIPVDDIVNTYERDINRWVMPSSQRARARHKQFACRRIVYGASGA